MRQLLIAVTVLVAASGAQAQSRAIALVGADVLTMEHGATLARGQTVLIIGDSIAAVGPTASVVVPRDAQRIDASGLVLLPGLHDMHVHLEAEPESWIGVFLAYGVTSMLNLRGGPTHLTLRDRIARGELVAPRVYTSGPYVNRPQIETVDDAIRAVREQKIAGYDAIKIHGPLGNLAYSALLDSARAARITVVGHAPRNLPFDTLIALRQPSVVHAEELIYTKFGAIDSTALGDVPRRMAEAGTWLTPTLSTYHGIWAQWARPSAADSALAVDDARFFSTGFKSYWKSSNPYTGRAAGDTAHIRRSYIFQKPLVRALHQAGVRILAGTDTPLPVMIPGASLHLELAELKGAGLDNYHAIAAATRNAGDFIREQINPGMRIGRIAPGYRADIILVRGDPLRDLSALQRPMYVVTQGRVLDRTVLDRLAATGR